jgi:hypothetical protein
VTDRGPGFAPAMLAQFGKPYQSSKGRPGGGLGLFLVVNVARTLGGACRPSQPAGGRRRGAPDAAAEGHRAGARGMRMKRMTCSDAERLLLIIEDDDAFARTLGRSFERRGYQVLLAPGLDEAPRNC